MTIIPFTKAVASGNDFIIFDNRDNNLAGDIADFSGCAKKICARKLSVGSDGLLVLDGSKKADFRMRIFNPDGSEAAMCGNGARSAALYANTNGWGGPRLKIETGAGIIEALVEGSNIRLKMTDPHSLKIGSNLGLGKTVLVTHFINTGVPHVVHFLDEDADLERYPVREIGMKVRRHKSFEPEGANADFVKVISGTRIAVRTYERGVEDETLACGTGAVASAVISHIVNKTNEPVEVLTKSGDILKVYFSLLNKKIHDVYLEGPAKIVYKGELVN